MSGLLSVPAFFGLRVVLALGLLKLSASFLPVSGFTVFSQLVLFASLLNVLALCGAQNGVVRQAAAARDDEELKRTQSAAFTIWLGVAPLALMATSLGDERKARSAVAATDSEVGYTSAGKSVVAPSVDSCRTSVVGNIANSVNMWPTVVVSSTPRWRRIPPIRGTSSIGVDR